MKLFLKENKICQSNKKILFLPDWRKGNPYQSLLSEAIKKHGFNVIYQDYLKTFSFPLYQTRKKNKVDIIHLHWVSPYFEKILWSDGWKFKIKLFLTTLDLLLVRSLGVKIVWTVHNLLAHESKNTKKELICRKLLARFCHKMIVHSNGAKIIVAKTYHVHPNKISMIRHGNYCGSYDIQKNLIVKYRKQYNISTDDTILLFIGAIRKYKGIEKLIHAFQKTINPNLKLVIAGKPFKQEDHDWLITEETKTKNLITDLRFIPDNEIASILSISDAIILPYIKTLTSGAAILAMSFKKPLIMPGKSKIFDLPGEKGAIYYDDDDKSNALSNTLANLQKYNLKEMGLYNYQLSLTLDWDSIAERTISSVYNN